MKKGLNIALLLIFILTIFISLPVYSQRNVLLEEFSGTWCGYCPFGADSINAIQQRLNNVIVLEYHYNDSMSTTNGDELINTLNPAFPFASIDRIQFPGHSMTPIRRELWGQRSLERSAVDPTFSIVLTPNYNSGNRNIELNITLKTLSELSGTYRINVVITEDSLNYKQKFYPLEGGDYDIYPYFHNHTVREMITGTYGEVLNSSSLAIDTEIQKTYNFTLNQGYNENQCHIVVFIHEDIKDNLGPVQQAEETRILLTTEIAEETEETTQPRNFELYQNYPNPFNPETTIKYQIPVDNHVELKIFNILGQEVKTLVNEGRDAGLYSVKWDGTNSAGEETANGIYIYMIKAGKFTNTKKLILLK